MKVRDKELTLRLDLGALKMVQELTDKNFFALGEKDFDPVLYSALLYACAKRGKSEISQDFIDSLTLNELADVQKELDKLMGDFADKGKKEKNLKPRS